MTATIERCSYVHQRHERFLHSAFAQFTNHTWTLIILAFFHHFSCSPHIIYTVPKWQLNQSESDFRRIEARVFFLQNNTINCVHRYWIISALHLLLFMDSFHWQSVKMICLKIHLKLALDFSCSFLFIEQLIVFWITYKSLDVLAHKREHEKLFNLSRDQSSVRIVWKTKPENLSNI